MPIARYIFASERNTWLATFFYVLLLYGTLTLAFDWYVWAYARLGRESVSWWINSGFAILGLGVLGWVGLRVPHRWSNYVALGLIALVLWFCLDALEVPAKRIHFLQYGPLTGLVFAATGFRHRGRTRYLRTLSLVALIGLGDELLQSALPQRHFGVLDLFVNTVAGILTLIFIGAVLRTEGKR